MKSNYQIISKMILLLIVHKVILVKLLLKKTIIANKMIILYN